MAVFSECVSNRARERMHVMAVWLFSRKKHGYKTHIHNHTHTHTKQHSTVCPIQLHLLTLMLMFRIHVSVCAKNSNGCKQLCAQCLLWIMQIREGHKHTQISWCNSPLCRFWALGCGGCMIWHILLGLYSITAPDTWIETNRNGKCS